MLKISDSIQHIIQGNALLHYGFHHKLLNMSQVADFIQPLLETRTKKPVSKSSIVMHLSRLQKRLEKITPHLQNFQVLNVTVRSDLCSMAFYRNQQVHDRLDKVYNEIQKNNGYMALNQGMNEITIIIDMASMSVATKILKDQPKYIKKNLASLGVQFDPKYAEIPGLLYYVIQQITLQNINIAEISSTYTEFVIYLEQKDMRLAFDTICQRFLVIGKD